jgi:hypothetical protein
VTPGGGSGDGVMQFPTFDGGSYDHHVAALHDTQTVLQPCYWTQAAIASSLERSFGHRGMGPTVIQKFCVDVSFNRQKFYRLTHTYCTFTKPCNTGVARLITKLSFKHFEIASRLARDPAAAVIEAHHEHWSANEFERQLTTRKDPPPFSIETERDAIVAFIEKRVADWPAGTVSSRDELGQFVDIIRDEVLDDFDALTFSPTYPELHALRWIKFDLQNDPFTKRNYNQTWGRGSDLEVSGGAAGSKIYQAIIGNLATAGRGRVLNAIDNLIAGRVTKLGTLALSIARDLAAGDRALKNMRTSPPSEGGDVTGTKYEVAPTDDEDYEPSPCVDELTITPERLAEMAVEM